MATLAGVAVLLKVNVERPHLFLGRFVELLVECHVLVVLLLCLRRLRYYYTILARTNRSRVLSYRKSQGEG